MRVLREGLINPKTSRTKEARGKTGWWAIPLCFVITACQVREQDRILIATPVVLSPDPLILTPRPPLTTTGYFTSLCIAIPPDYEEDTKMWQLRAPDGNLVSVSAILQTKSGALLQLDKIGFLSGKKDYVYLRVPASHELDAYEQISVRATLPLETDEIRWLSTDKQ